VSEPKSTVKPFLRFQMGLSGAYGNQGNKGAAGVDGESMQSREDEREPYKLGIGWFWTYFPAVRAVRYEEAGGTRTLGVPTVADRIAQTVSACTGAGSGAAVSTLTPTAIVLGVRPRALARTAACWESDWVIDLDIRAFFDSIPHSFAQSGVEAHGPALGSSFRAAVAEKRRSNKLTALS